MLYWFVGTAHGRLAIRKERAPVAREMARMDFDGYPIDEAIDDEDPQPHGVPRTHSGDVARLAAPDAGLGACRHAAAGEPLVSPRHLPRGRREPPSLEDQARPVTDPTTSGIMRATGLTVLSKRTVAVAVVLLMALVWAGGALEEHDADVCQFAGHADCDACHFRHLSVVETDGAPAPSELDLAAHAVASTHARAELRVALGIHPTRGPPA